MSKWKCEICGVEFENFHAQGFDNKIYCPLCYFKKENQELKKQIEDLFTENSKLRKKLEKSMTFQDYEYTLNKKIQLENQQKEFIEYLEDRIKFWKDKIFENAITESDWTLTLWRNKLGILEESLSKYKESIGGKNGN